ncbi:MAG: hypothetical protein Q9162_001150 [Coniocarpon cinnabarinum]
MNGLVERNAHLLWTALPVVATVPLILYVVYQRLFSPLAGIPGPFLASVSRFWLTYVVWKGGMHERLPALHHQYGPLAAAGSGFRKSNWYNVWQGHRKFDLFGEQDERIHGHQRRLVSSAYSLKSIQDLEKYIDDAVAHFLKRMEDIRSQTIDMSKWIQYFAFDVIGEVTFSKRFGFMDVGDEDDDYLSPIFGHQAACQARHGSMRNFAIREISARQERGSDHDDILGKLFAIHEEKPRDFNETAIASMASSNIFAGSDTTAASTRALLYWVLKHPECETRLINEILEARASGNLSNIAKREEAENLPYFMACLWEALRFHPQPGLVMPRVVPAGGLDVNGHFLPRETVVGCSPWVLHKNKDIFGPDAEHFNPDRWLKGDASEMHIAETEIKKLIPTLLLHYDVKLADPSKNWVISSWWFAIQSEFYVTLRPRSAE